MTTITTARLTLRPLEVADMDGVLSGLNNFNVSRWTGKVPFPLGEDDASAFIARALPADALVLAILRQSALIGVAGLERGDLGYWLAEPHWGQGYGTEAARAIVDHAFEVMKVAGIDASYHIGNAASRKILLGLGFVEAGEGSAYSRARQAEVPHMKLKLTRFAWAEAKERRR